MRKILISLVLIFGAITMSSEYNLGFGYKTGNFEFIPYNRGHIEGGFGIGFDEYPNAYVLMKINAYESETNLVSVYAIGRIGVTKGLYKDVGIGLNIGPLVFEADYSGKFNGKIGYTFGTYLKKKSVEPDFIKYKK